MRKQSLATVILDSQENPSAQIWIWNLLLFKTRKINKRKGQNEGEKTELRNGNSVVWWPQFNVDSFQWRKSLLPFSFWNTSSPQ